MRPPSLLSGRRAPLRAAGRWVLVCLFSLALLLPGGARGAGRVFLLLSEESPPYTTVARHLEEVFSGARRIEDEGAFGLLSPESVLVCLGNRALNRASRRAVPGRVVFSLVIAPEREVLEGPLHREGRLYGVLLSFPPERYLAWLRALFPGVSRVGFLYTGPLPFALPRGAPGLEVTPLPVPSREALEGVLRQAATRVEALVVLPDSLLVNQVVFPRLVFFSIEQGIVLVSLSERLARAGALLALGWDFEDLAGQTARLVERLLAGEEVEPRFLFPRREIPYVNERILKVLDLRLPPSARRRVVPVRGGGF